MSAALSAALPLGTQLVSNAIGPAAAALLAANPPTNGYTTRPAGPLPPALYSLAIRGATAPHIPYFIYTFPLSPYSLRKESVGMANHYDVAGSPGTFGVARVADVYGLSPPTFLIAGTTGVKNHSTDRFLFTGLQSILILQAALAQYFSLVSAAGQSQTGSSSLPRLEFYDFYAGEFWQVMPEGPQGIFQDSSRPQLLNYQFRLVGLSNLAAPLIGLADMLLGAISGGISQAVSSAGSLLSSSLAAYSPWSPAAAGAAT